MSQTLKDLRQEQARLESRIQSLQRQNASNSTLSNITSGSALAAGIGMALLPGVGTLASITVGLSYATPEIAVTIAGNNIDAQIEDATNKLTDNFKEQQYQSLSKQLSEAQDQQRQMELMNEIVDRHMDRYVRDVVDRMGRDIDSRDRGRDYDHVEPPSRDFDFGGNDYSGGGDTAYA